MLLLRRIAGVVACPGHRVLAVLADDL